MVFLGMVGYCSDYIPRYADLAAPLNDLKKKDVPWVWGEKEQQAFDALKDALVSAPVLAHPDFTKPFRLETDASHYAVSAVLTQKDEATGVWRPIAYRSKKMIPRERNLAPTEMECLAIIYGLRRFHNFLEGQEFDLITDHKALRWLLETKDPKDKMRRWVAEVNEYDYHVIHRPGRETVVPDALSRMERDDTDEDVEEGADEVPRQKASVVGAVQGQPLSWNEVRKEQGKDLECQVWKDHLEGRMILPQGVKGTPTFLLRLSIRDGVVVYQTDGGKKVPFVPECLRPKLLYLCHDSKMGSHQGRNKVVDLVKEYYWWPEFSGDIDRYVKSCPRCKPNSVPQVQESITAIRTRFPNELVGLDLFGPLPDSKGGYKYVAIMTDYFTK